MKALIRMLLALIAAGLFAFYVQGVAQPTLAKIEQSVSGRDYATYHYAVQEAWDGGDPYDTRALSRRARAEGTRKTVHPYFYPPPFLMGMTWAVDLPLATGYRAWFWINQACIVGLLLVFRFWFRAPWIVLAGVLAIFTPLADSVKMGQANLLVLLLASVGIWRTRGEALALAALAKMSPALFLAWWVARGWLGAVAVAVLAAVGISLLNLGLVPIETQLRFYTEILPGFGSGNYHGLKVPIDLPGNHSVADVLNLWRPGPNAHALDPLVQKLNLGFIGVATVVLALVARTRRDPLGEALLAGAFTVLIVISPVYTYEHHLAMLMLPLVAVGAAAMGGRFGQGWILALVLAFGMLSMPWGTVKALAAAQEAPLGRLILEGKFIAELVLGLGCVVAARRSLPG